MGATRMGGKLGDKGKRSGLKIHNPDRGPGRAGDGGHAAGWMVSGYKAEVRVWTDEEYRRPGPPRPDAQRLENGLWVALRMA